MVITLPDSCAMHVELSGNDAAPPVVFVHGFPLSGAMWRGAGAALSDGWRCIVPDLRGHGASGTVGCPGSVSIASMSDDLIAMLDALGERRACVFVGLSMGGIVCFDLFRRHRARVRALVLCCTRPNDESPEGVERRKKIAADAMREGAGAVAAHMIGAVLAPEADARVRAEVLAMMEATAREGVAAGSLALAGREDSWGTLDAMDVPTLFVAGEKDGITPVELHRRMHERVRGSALAVIPGAGHVPPMERTGEFVGVLREFLQSLE